MFEAAYDRGRVLLTQLMRLTDSGTVRAEDLAEEQIRFARSLTIWRYEVAGAIRDALGSDPESRFSYLLHLVEEGLKDPSDISPETIRLLEGAVSYLSRLDDQLDPGHLNRFYDWSLPPDPDETPTLAQIEAKRWEFCEALLRDSRRTGAGTLDPLVTARSIDLNELHAREFFVGLVRIGRLPRESFTSEWRDLARSVDSEISHTADETFLAQPQVGARAFMCHASEDKGAVRELSRLLKDHGHYPWLDEEQILPGQDWAGEIRKALRHSDVVLVCLSTRSSKRGYVQKELRQALDIADEFPDGTIFLIPVRLEECSVPERLSSLHWVNLYEASGTSRLLAALERRGGDVD